MKIVKINENNLNILFEGVTLRFTNVVEPDNSKYGNNKYNCHIMLAQKSEDVKTIVKILKGWNAKNDKFYPIKKDDLVKLQEKARLEPDKKEKIDKYIEMAKDFCYIKVTSNYQPQVVDKQGKVIEDLTKIQLNGVLVNIQIKLQNFTDSEYFGKYLTGIQVLELKEKGSNLMFEAQETSIEENEEDLPF